MFETIKAKYDKYKTKVVSYYRSSTQIAPVGFWVTVSLVMAVILVVGSQILSFVFGVIQVVFFCGLILGIAYLLVEGLSSWKNK